MNSIYAIPNAIRMNNNFNIEEFQKSLSEKSEVLLKEVIEMMESYYFYDLLFYCAVKMQRDTAEWMPVADQPIAIIDYIISLVLSLDVEKLKFQRADQKQCEIFNQKVMSLWTGSWLRSALSDTDPLVTSVKTHFLNVRGNDYDEHLFAYLRWLFNDFTPFLNKEIGFDITDLIGTYEYLRVYHDEENPYNKMPFVFIPKDEKQKKIFDYLSADIWENKEFLEWENGWLAWNKTIVPRKSIIRHQDLYFAFHPLLLLWNIKDILEFELKKDWKVWDRYNINRANYLENRSIEYIVNILPWSKGYTNLKYWKDFETDGLVVYDNNLFIIEAKAGVLKNISKRWDIKWLDDDINRLMIEWYSQALRTKKYIENNSIVNFKSENGDIIAIDKANFNRIFLINTTWDFLWPIALYLDLQKNKWNLDVLVNFWSTYINVLRVISEIIEFPSQFILFLERRFKLINSPQIRFADELDVFMEFFKSGIYYDDWMVNGENIDNFSMFSMDTTLTDEIDRYYWWEWVKPSMRIYDEHKKIINDIENTGKFGFSEVSTFLLALNHKEFMAQIDMLKSKVLNDNKEHSFTVLYEKEKVIFMLLLKNESEYLNKIHYDQYSKLKIWQTWLPKAYNLYLDITESGDIKFNDFKIVKLTILEQTREYLERLEQFKKTHSLEPKNNWSYWKVIYKKHPCPCWSWKKYKHCCFNEVD